MLYNILIFRLREKIKTFSNIKEVRFEENRIHMIDFEKKDYYYYLKMGDTMQMSMCYM